MSATAQKKSLWTRPVAAIGAALIGGCSLTPGFDSLTASSSNVAPTVDQLIDHIQCEIVDVEKGKGIQTDEEKQALNKFLSQSYIVYATLTLDVTNSQGLSPSLNFINPYVVAGTNVTQMLGGQITGMQHRNINPSFTLDLDPKNIDPVRSQKCSEAAGTFGLSGDLGIKELILAGVQRSTEADFMFPFPSSTEMGAIKAATAPAFASTIDFTVNYSFNAGPVWTLKHFKGPSGSSGLVSAGRIDKDTLVLSFASAGPRPTASVPPAPPAPAELPPPPNASRTEKENFLLRQTLKNLTERLAPQPAAPGTGPSANDKAAAAAAAQSNATRLILQNILPSIQP